MVNDDLRQLINQNNVYRYEIAYELGITETWLRVLLHSRLKPGKRQEIVSAIRRVAEGKGNTFIPLNQEI